MLLLLLTTGCTKTLTDSDKKAVKNETTGQTLTENILCRPTNKETIKLYEKNKVKIDKLPTFNTPLEPTTIPFGETKTNCPFPLIEPA